MVKKDDWNAIRTLVTEGLAAGGSMLPKRTWEAHHNGVRLLIRDRKLGDERKGAIVITNRISESILMTAAMSGLRNYIIVGNELVPSVELARLRAERLKSASKFGDHYWAVYIIAEKALVSVGNPYSSSRIVGEIIHAQFGGPFEQRKVCGHCGELNRYGSGKCVRCGARLSATGQLNRWVHYDDDETIARKLTPDEKRRLANALSASSERTLTSTATIRHKLTREELERIRKATIKGAPDAKKSGRLRNGILKTFWKEKR